MDFKEEFEKRSFAFRLGGIRQYLKVDSYTCESTGTHARTRWYTQEGVRLLATNTSNSQLLFSCYLSLPPKRVGQLISSEPQGVITQGAITYECGTNTRTHVHTRGILVDGQAAVHTVYRRESQSVCRPCVSTVEQQLRQQPNRLGSNPYEVWSNFQKMTSR